jgi:hypothetical protein
MGTGENEDMSGDLHKACFVILGNTQTESFSYDRTFAPMLSKDLLRLLLAVAL